MITRSVNSDSGEDGGESMSINSVSGNYKQDASIESLFKEKQDKPKKQKSSQIAQAKQEEYIPSQQQTKQATYQKPKLKSDEIMIKQLKAESEKAYSQLRDLVERLLSRQGKTFNDLKETDVIKVDEKARVEAQAMIAEGGEYSAENVSDRIVSFAKAISGGDKSKLDMLRGAIEEGFRQASNVLGGALPEISNKTYALVMEKLDAWEQED